MVRYRITAPVKHVQGTVAGVVFSESVAETDSVNALAYFRRHGYLIEEIVAEPAPAEPEPPADPPVEAPAPPAKAARAAKTSTGGTA